MINTLMHACRGFQMDVVSDQVPNVIVPVLDLFTVLHSDVRLVCMLWMCLPAPVSLPSPFCTPIPQQGCLELMHSLLTACSRAQCTLPVMAVGEREGCDTGGWFVFSSFTRQLTNSLSAFFTLCNIRAVPSLCVHLSHSLVHVWVFSKRESSEPVDLPSFDCT